MISFVVPGIPQGKGRARSFARKLPGGRVISGNYTPEKTRNYESFIAQRFCAAYPNFVPIDGPVIMTVRAYFPIPNSASKKLREQMILGNLRPTKKPDLSNVEKAVEDALNTIAFRDDSAIVERGLGDGKYYTDGQPRVEVEITEWKPFV